MQMSLLIVVLMRFVDPYKSSYENETAKHDTFQRCCVVHFRSSQFKFAQPTYKFTQPTYQVDHHFAMHCPRGIGSLRQHRQRGKSHVGLVQVLGAVSADFDFCVAKQLFCKVAPGVILVRSSCGHSPFTWKLSPFCRRFLCSTTPKKSKI